MKILLISANTFTRPYPVYPLGLDYVAHAVSPSHSVRIADLNTFDTDGKLRRTVAEFMPDLIGLSLRNIDNTDHSAPFGFIREYREIVRELREHSGAPLVLGGSGFTLFPDELMKALGADYGIIGEGERFSALADALSDGNPLSEIPGLVLPRKTAPVPPPLGRPFVRRFSHRNPHVDYYLKNGGMMNLQTQRGCPFRCIYCTYPRIEGRRLRPAEPEEAAETAVQLQAAGARYLFITDSAFNARQEHALAVADAFRKAGLSIPWGAFFAPVKPVSGFYERMAEAGLSHVEFGTESLCNRTLSSYQKPYEADHALEAHRHALKAGLHTAHYFLPGGPGETPDTLERTLSRVEFLKRGVFFFFCGMRIYPHTPLFDLAVQEGKLSPDQNLLAPIYYESSEISPTAILSRVKEKAEGRRNWIIGAGGDDTADIITRMYARGYTGPLWEYLIA